MTRLKGTKGEKFEESVANSVPANVSLMVEEGETSLQHLLAVHLIDVEVFHLISEKFGRLVTLNKKPREHQMSVSFILTGL